MLYLSLSSSSHRQVLRLHRGKTDFNSASGTHLHTSFKVVMCSCAFNLHVCNSWKCRNTHLFLLINKFFQLEEISIPSCNHIFTLLFSFLWLSNIQKEQTVIWLLRQQTPENVSIVMASSKCSQKVAISSLLHSLFLFLFPSQEQRRLANKQKTSQRQQVFQLRSIKASIKQQEQETKDKQKQRKANQEAQKAQPRRLGKLKYTPSTLLLPTCTC